MSRSDVKELGELIDANQAALLIIGKSTIEAAVDRALVKAAKHVAKQLDTSAKDLDEAVEEAAAEVS